MWRGIRTQGNFPNELSLFIPVCMGVEDPVDTSRSQGNHWIALIIHLEGLNNETKNILDQKADDLITKNINIASSNVNLLENTKALYKKISITVIDSVSSVDQQNSETDFLKPWENNTDLKKSYTLISETGQGDNECGDCTVVNGLSFMFNRRPALSTENLRAKHRAGELEASVFESEADKPKLTPSQPSLTGMFAGFTPKDRQEETPLLSPNPNENEQQNCGCRLI